MSRRTTSPHTGHYVSMAGPSLPFGVLLKVFYYITVVQRVFTLTAPNGKDPS
uniref:Uncharacterized protein n=1 Tax=Anguilla anguilla TaxID=7936 RepID=A0A0E9QQV1_ANGAN